LKKSCGEATNIFKMPFEKFEVFFLNIIFLYYFIIKYIGPERVQPDSMGVGWLAT
jgi:hypothetical protein